MAMGVSFRQVGLVLAILLVAYVLFALWAGSFSFLATVTSDSMRPALERGDWVLMKSEPAYAVGDVLVFSVGPSVYVHRVIGVVGDPYGGGYKTRGDANRYPDGWIVPNDAVLGNVVLRIPRLGYLSLWLVGK